VFHPARVRGHEVAVPGRTVARPVSEGLAVVGPGEDGRRLIASLTPKAEALLSALDAEWTATAAAATAFEAELSHPRSEPIGEALEALGRRPMRRRIADAAPHLISVRD
jgi:hypothetical protein